MTDARDCSDQHRNKLRDHVEPTCYFWVMEDRLIELETTIAFQDERVIKLEQIVSQQQLELHQLAEGIERLRKQLVEVAPSLVSDSEDEAGPPHY